MGWFNSFKKDPFKDYLRKIFDHSVESANTIQRDWGLDDMQWFAVLFEFLYLFLNLTDRVAFTVLGNEKRDKIMTELEEISISSAVKALCHDWRDDKIKKIEEECRHNYIVSMEEWGQCKGLFSEKDKGMKDNLFWEFSKVIAKLAGHEKDIAYMLLPTELATAALKDLDPKLFIEKMK